MIDLQESRFHYRVAGVATHKGRVLLHRSEIDDFWSLPGGRARLLEPAAGVLRREMRKELGAEVQVVRLLWVVENFFWERGKPHHELGLYFLMSLEPGSRLYSHDGPFPGDEEGLALEFQWYPQEEKVLAQLPVYPAFLATGWLQPRSGLCPIPGFGNGQNLVDPEAVHVDHFEPPAAASKMVPC
jgi:ADP-ribose pyrophosphatase YjhB (NUDIX family)